MLVSEFYIKNMHTRIKISLENNKLTSWQRFSHLNKNKIRNITATWSHHSKLWGDNFPHILSAVYADLTVCIESPTCYISKNIQNAGGIELRGYGLDDNACGKIVFCGNAACCYKATLHGNIIELIITMNIASAVRSPQICARNFQMQGVGQENESMVSGWCSPQCKAFLHHDQPSFDVQMFVCVLVDH